MKEHIPLKYECLDRYSDVISKCSDNEAKQLLVEMFELIRYQMTEIQHQRTTIIAQKQRILD
jgi:hypothetical protein